MTRLAIAFAAFFVLTGTATAAGRGHDKFDGDGPPGLADKPYGLPPGQAKKLWRRGERLPAVYIGPRYFVAEPRVYHLAPARPGHRWVVVDGDAYLVEISSGLIAETVFGVVAVNYGPPPPPAPVVVVEPEDRWRKRYARTYTVEDDPFYRDCHQSVNPAGVIGGAVIGGLLGNALGHGGGRTGATVAGVVVGGAVGAALTSHLSCEDRGYAYKTYVDGFSAGRPNSKYEWRNPKNGNYGELQVHDYYRDPDNFRCANYTQRIFVNGRPQTASGRACQQPGGTWAIVS
jgi:surface antigen/Ni/Co efflux regulator RcnB